MFVGSGKILYKVRGQDDEVLRLMWCPQYEVTVRKTVAESSKRWTAMERIDRIRNEPEPEDVDPPEAFAVEKKLDLPIESLETSGTDKNLPEDSFDDSISVPEDDMFDIYKDHEADEFGHKKYVPEAVYVKVELPHKSIYLLKPIFCKLIKSSPLFIKSQAGLGLRLAP